MEGRQLACKMEPDGFVEFPAGRQRVLFPLEETRWGAKKRARGQSALFCCGPRTARTAVRGPVRTSLWSADRGPRTALFLEIADRR